MSNPLDSAGHPFPRNLCLPAPASRGPRGSLPALLALIVLLLAGCDTLSDVEDPGNSTDSFFPLKVGQRWTYEVTESDVDTNILPWPLQTTVTVLGDRTVAGKKYFLVHNYFTPGPYLPDIVLVRNEGSYVFVRFVDDLADRLLYSFAPADTVWNVPMYVNPEKMWPYYGFQYDLTDQYVAVHWYDSVNQRGESHWEEIFERGVGRTKIVAETQVYGTIEWELVGTD